MKKMKIVDTSFRFSRLIKDKCKWNINCSSHFMQEKHHYFEIKSKMSIMNIMPVYKSMFKIFFLKVEYKGISEFTLFQMTNVDGKRRIKETIYSLV